MKTERLSLQRQAVGRYRMELVGGENDGERS